MKPDGGPAYPIYGQKSVADDIILSAGMSLRDYFAGQALSGMNGAGGSFSAIAEWAYRYADAMIVERAKK
jgi:hypothetical protein